MPSRLLINGYIARLKVRILCNRSIICSLYLSNITKKVLIDRIWWGVYSINKAIGALDAKKSTENELEKPSSQPLEKRDLNPDTHKQISRI
jgi:hypothetical protein